METITISTKNHETYSAVSNFFIDYYMTDANGEFVKVYLYLVRLLHSGKSLTISDIADHFNLTQKDICRAIKYWIKEGVLQLEYNSDNTLTGITLLPLSPKEAKQEDDSLLSMLGIKPKDQVETPQQNYPDSREEAVTSEESSIEDEADEMRTVPEKVKYKAAFIEDKKTNDEDFANLVFQIKTYFDRPLTQADFHSIMYIYNDLQFSPDLLEYLIEYCVSLGKKSCRYIEAVAIDWYKSGIQTVADAKDVSQKYNSTYTSVLKALGIPRRVATSEEMEYINTWYNQFGFDKNIILEACKRAISNNPHSPSFHYVNGILKNWHNKKIHKLSDIEVLDKQWAKIKKEKEEERARNISNQIDASLRSISDETLEEMEQLILNQASKKTDN